MWYSGEVRTVVKWWCLVMLGMGVVQVVALSGDNVCMVNQKYKITKRVKYRAPMSVRTYEWCFSMPPRCSRWTTEMRDLTRLETEERTAEVAVCCPGYKMQDISCVPICPNGKTGDGCTKDCPSNKWGPNCVNDCRKCDHGTCSAITGECQCQTGWQGESCETIIPTTTVATMIEELLTTNKTTPKHIIKPTANTIAFASATSQPIKISTSPTLSTTTTERMLEIPKIVTEARTTKSKTEPTTTSTMKTTATVAQEEKTTANVLTTITQKTTFSTSNFSTTANQATSSNSNLSLQTHPRSQENYTKTFNENQHIYNRTEIPTTQKTLLMTTEIMITAESTPSISHITKPQNVKPTELKTQQTSHNVATTNGLATTVSQTMSTKFKIKEIWIKPAQKGDQLIESKIKDDPQQRQRTYNKKELTSTHTTPRTIVVSIIPTSVSYTLFKKIALSTTSYVPVKHYSKSIARNGTTHTKPIPIISSTSTTFLPVKNFTTLTTKGSNETFESKYHITETPISTLATTKIISTSMQSTYSSSTTKFLTNKFLSNASPTKEPHLRTTKQISVGTNSMKFLTDAYNKSSQLTTTPFKSRLFSTSMPRPFVSSYSPEIYKNTSATIMPNKPLEIETIATDKKLSTATKKPFHKNEKTNDTKKNDYGTNTDTKTITTAVPFSNEETFHILTEPEHITAVMGDREIGRTSVDLTSVISIAGGVMMVIITLAILLVMMERRRKPRYEDIRKMEDMRMQVYLDENDVPPPPYVRSIFHTPLPDPPVAEKCHYQPISTLDRNIKQFMRPVVVQTISPIMLENFRGILECHYDHLPLRNSLPVSHDEQLTPSIRDCHELICMRPHSISETDIEALKCEAKQDVIDNTTSEPLYAEIPCWRPPSEHAFEVMNLNGEAVTEL